MKFIKILIGFGISFLITLFVLDQFVYLANIQGTSPNDFDTVIGRKRRANLDFTYFNEGFAMGRFNEYEYLGPGYPIEKEKGHLRIAVLGDSYVESFQVFRRNQFHTVIEDELSEAIGRTVEVLNFGRSGFDFADMYAYQRRFVDRFAPDIIIYMISDGDLICTQDDPLIPKVVNRNGNLVVTNDEMPKGYLHTFQKTKIFTQCSSVFNMLNNARKLIHTGAFWHKMLGKFYTKPEQELITQDSLSVSSIAYNILANLDSNVLIVNRGKTDFPFKFKQEIKNQRLFLFRTKDTLEILQKNGSDPYYWGVTNTYGHWNHVAHHTVGLYLSRRLEQIL